jgi:hypothetical protein
MQQATIITHRSNVTIVPRDRASRTPLRISSVMNGDIDNEESIPRGESFCLSEYW